jgi:hypothetical protein
MNLTVRKRKRTFDHSEDESSGSDLDEQVSLLRRQQLQVKAMGKIDLFRPCFILNKSKPSQKL